MWAELLGGVVLIKLPSLYAGKSSNLHVVDNSRQDSEFVPRASRQSLEIKGSIAGVWKKK